MISEIKQLLLEPGTLFALVEGATELAQVSDRPLVMPAAYVIPLEQVSSPNSRATGPVLQRTEADIGVIIILENLSSTDGDAVADELETSPGNNLQMTLTDWGKPVTVNKPDVQ